MPEFDAPSLDVAPDMAQPSLTRQLVELIRAKPVTDTDLETAALFTLDAIANSCAGQNSEPGRVLLAWFQDRGFQDRGFQDRGFQDRGFQDGPSRNQAPDTGKSAFLLGALTHILETDDLHRQSVVHPGCVVVPPAWTLATAHGIGGRSFLRAVLHGFEATTRVGMAVGAEHYRIWHNTSTCGPFGSAMACAALLDLDDGAATHALGNAGSQAAGLWEFLETGTMTKHLHAGHASQAGVQAAELARHGFTGPPRILEGEKGFFRATCENPTPDMVVADPQAPWQLLGTSIKPWPSCRHTHPAIDAAIETRSLLNARGINPMSDELVSISATVYQAALDVCNRPDPTSEYEAKFSLQHTIAAGLALDHVGFDAFGEDARHQLAPLRSKVSVELGEPYASAYPRVWGSKISLTLKSGDVIFVQRTHAKGDPEAPLSQDEMIAKAQMLLSHAGIAHVDAFISAVLALPQDKALPTLPIDM